MDAGARGVIGRPNDARPHREDAAVIVREFAEGASGTLQEGFLGRTDVAELLQGEPPG